MTLNKFDMGEKLVVITGGSGLLGAEHAEAIAEIGGIPVILDIDEAKSLSLESTLNKKLKINAKSFAVDVTNEAGLIDVLRQIRSIYGKAPYGLINNATIDPKFDNSIGKTPKSRLEVFPLEQWNKEIGVGLTGAFLCSKVFGAEMAKEGRGVILNIASDLGIIAPDQRLYRKVGLSDDLQNVKPITYSAIKHGLIGMTKYLATYWADKGIRCNAFAPGGVYNNHSDEFVQKISNLIPMGRMAKKGEYRSAIQFLISDASSYMTGNVLVMDGGRSCW